MARRCGTYSNGSQRARWVGARHETSAAERPLVRLEVGYVCPGSHVCAKLAPASYVTERVLVASQF